MNAIGKQRDSTVKGIGKGSDRFEHELHAQADKLIENTNYSKNINPTIVKREPPIANNDWKNSTLQG